MILNFRQAHTLFAFSRKYFAFPEKLCDRSHRTRFFFFARERNCFVWANTKFLGGKQTICKRTQKYWLIIFFPPILYFFVHHISIKFNISNLSQMFLLTCPPPPHMLSFNFHCCCGDTIEIWQRSPPPPPQDRNEDLSPQWSAYARTFQAHLSLSLERDVVHTWHLHFLSMG